MAGCSLNQADIKFIFKVNNASAELGFTNIFGLTGRTKAAVFYDQIEIIKSSKELINVRSTHLNVRLECLSILILAVELIFG